ncbi:GNAT family N-acetyltransferase [Mucilaginibacter phyllosphaerae]
MQTYPIYKTKYTEYPELITLWEASVRATHHFLNDDDIQFYKHLLQDYLPVLDIYSIKHEEKLYGFMGIDENRLQALFIHPDVIRMGIGKQLLNYAVGKMGINRVDVNEQNHQALCFYERMGFKAIGRTAVDGAGKPFPLLLMQLN